MLTRIQFFDMENVDVSFYTIYSASLRSAVHIVTLLFASTLVHTTGIKFNGTLKKTLIQKAFIGIII